ncbi:FMN-binding domain-containing protein [Arthrobacter sp. ov407]|uniref:FMN-binding protein n=1 Tax=Arthrobacter sp. ov407 TaxID=1761748 RepID=UPI00088426C0|nr:FMN-binding protein [Arthrobacter sp. ov407]SDL93615.1 FMN-binding domain-containing protein [Arthrobacter sp. ov407]
MRTRAAVSAVLASGGILIAGWQSGVHIADTSSSVASGAAGTTGATGAKALGTDGSSGTGTTGAAGTTGASAKAVGTYAGPVVQTRFGSVQVQISVRAGKITDVTALQLTDAERKSVQISNRAAPLLRDEVLQAQSADVQTISGATVTSDAYLNSLQAALDAANL